MHPAEIKRLAETTLAPALAVARVQMRYFAGHVSVEVKADHSPVTAADRESEEIIHQALARIAPGVAVVAEEAMAAGQKPAVADTFFLVDPLDGTKGFIKGRGEFTINIALIEAGSPVFGLVYAPALSDFYVTLGPQEAGNARLAPDSQARTLSDIEIGIVRSRVPDPNALAALTSQSHLNRATQGVLDAYGVVESRAIASSLKFGLIARGEADLYPRCGPTSEWDTAAGHAVLAAAGGSVTTLDGAPLLYGRAGSGFINPDFIAWGRTPLPKRRTH